MGYWVIFYMRCPACGYSLQKLSVTTNSGSKFEIDHCGYCGGTWFDPYEINRIPYHEVVRMAHLYVKPKNINLAPNIPYCPRCKRILESFHSESVPKNIHFLHCPNCRGIWAAGKSLEEFKKHEDEYLSSYQAGFKPYPSTAIFFAPLVFVILLFVTTFITINNLNRVKDNRTKALEIVQNINILKISNSACILSFTTINEMTSQVLIGESILEMKNKSASNTPAKNHNITLQGLKENTEYLYIIEIRDKMGNRYKSEIKKFKN